MTSNPTTLREYIEHKLYDAAFDRDIKLEEDSDVVRARKNDALVFYPWRRVPSGVIYGGCGPCHSYADGDEGGSNQQAPCRTAMRPSACTQARTTADARAHAGGDEHALYV